MSQHFLYTLCNDFMGKIFSLLLATNIHQQSMLTNTNMPMPMGHVTQNYKKRNVLLSLSPTLQQVKIPTATAVQIELVFVYV